MEYRTLRRPRVSLHLMLQREGAPQAGSGFHAAIEMRQGALRRGTTARWGLRVFVGAAAVSSLRSRCPNETAVCDYCRSHPSSDPFQAFGGRRRSSVERDDDLAVGAALLDVGQRFGGLVERERLVDDRAEVAGVVEGGQFA